LKICREHGKKAVWIYIRLCVCWEYLSADKEQDRAKGNIFVINLLLEKKFCFVKKGDVIKDLDDFLCKYGSRVNGFCNIFELGCAEWLKWF